MGVVLYIIAAVILLGIPLYGLFHQEKVISDRSSRRVAVRDDERR